MEQLESNVNILIDECAREDEKTCTHGALVSKILDSGKTKTPGEGACVSS